ncbi:MAG: aspartate/glutamate racemase family protein, partial [Planctomycetaceae bacterium]|nr:aspartate/glutamate racemase family protein [Planctomycetaceae bacterium]
VYLGDQANMPYGNYDSVGKDGYLRELILKDATFLLGRRRFQRSETEPRLNKPPVKAIVIACNTATAAGLEDIQQLLHEYQIAIPVIGVVAAGSRGVLQVTGSDREPATVAVLATVGTCSTGAYPRWIGRTHGLAGRRVPQVVQFGSARMAGVIEGSPGFTESIADRTAMDVKSLVEQYRENTDLQPQPIRTVVLGCTHFPLAQAEINDAFQQLRTTVDAEGKKPYASLIAAELTFVDPAEWTARELFHALAQGRLRNPESGATGNDMFFLSVPNPASPGIELDDSGGLTSDYKYGREAGHWDLEDTRNEPLDPHALPPATLRLIQDKLPAVWQRLQQASAAP